MSWNLHPRNKPGLLWAVLEQLQDRGARISLEGYLGKTALLQHPSADTLETVALKRQGQSWPESDFVTMPVTAEIVQLLKTELSGSGVFGHGGWLIHVQVEVNGKIAFGGYDSFHKECVGAAEPLTADFLGSLVKNGVLVSFS